MKDIIKIHDTKKGKVINARELHAYMESNRQFANWIKERISTYGFVINQDYITFNKIVKRENGGGSKRIEYSLNIDIAKVFLFMVIDVSKTTF